MFVGAGYVGPAVIMEVEVAAIHQSADDITITITARTVNYSANLSFPAKKTSESRVDMSGASPSPLVPRCVLAAGCGTAPRPAHRPTFTRTMWPAPAVPTLAWPGPTWCPAPVCSTAARWLMSGAAARSHLD